MEQQVDKTSIFPQNTLTFPFMLLCYIAHIDMIYTGDDEDIVL